MDEMMEWEATSLMEMIDHADRNLWECCRMQMYIIAQVNSKKKLKPKDIMKFPWEKASAEETNITNNDIERLKQKAELMKKKLL